MLHESHGNQSLWLSVFYDEGKEGERRGRKGNGNEP
jgi:hypothetical protein